jgi:hypothetical protein
MIIKVFRDGTTKVEDTDFQYTDWITEFVDPNLEYLQSRTRSEFTEWTRDDANRALALEVYWKQEHDSDKSNPIPL